MLLISSVEIFAPPVLPDDFQEIPSHIVPQDAITDILRTLMHTQKLHIPIIKASEKRNAQNAV